MKKSTARPFKCTSHVTALSSLLALGLLALPAKMQAVEDPPGCSFPAGAGNASESGINFDKPQAHIGDSVPVFPRLGMVDGACRAIHATGSVWTAASAVQSLTNFLIDVTLDPGAPISCPGPNLNCQPGPYLVTITAPMVGAGVTHPAGFTPGVAKAVRAVVIGQGTVLTLTDEQLGGFNTATIGIVTPCIQVVKQCAYPANSPTCFPAGANIDFTGYVTNCGDIRLTNVTVVDSRPLLGLGLTDLGGFPLIQPLTLDPGQAIAFKGSYAPTLAETCAGSAANTITVRGTDITIIGGPFASVTNTATANCAICVNPCLQVTKNCDSVVIGSANTVSGSVTNCGNIAITNIVISDNIYGTLATIPSLAPGASQSYSRLVTNNTCGSFPNTVTAAGTTTCGAPIQAQATSTCVVTGNPCLVVTKSCDTVNIGQANTVSALVSNCGNVTITGIVVSDNLYGAIGNIASLAPGATATLTKSVTNLVCGDFPNIVTATGTSVCGTPTPATSTAVCRVLCAPEICVTKEVVCELPNGCANNWSHLATGAKTADETQCPSFCYRIRVTNCGEEDLRNVTVVDNVLSLAACNFPTTLAVNQTVECIISGVEHCDSVTNTVTASGVGVNSGVGVSTNDRAAVVIRPISITCNVTVNGKSHETIPCDGQAHAIDNAVEICNTGELPLANITIYAPDIVALGGDCANVANLRLSLLPGECTNVFLCTELVTCPPSCGIAFSNHITITATVDQGQTPICSWTRNQSNEVVAVTATTECDATVGCIQPNACRTTGGGRQDDPLVYPEGPRYVTHGGQVGAPVGNKICVVTEEFYLGNPCIHGRWTHVRHEKGGLRGNFHARYYDTLDCACLDTNTTVGVVVVPGVNGAPDQSYANLVYGAGTVTEGVCNADDHKVAGPQPRPAPANKIVFTGVGDWADPNGRRTPRATLFRVDIEDRSEPGGSHPKGGVAPPDRYRIRIWVLTPDEVKLLKGAASAGGLTDRYLLNFRNAIAACIGLNVQDGATVPNGTAAFGVRAPDIDDGGELERGNHQIHPAIKNCDPLNPTGPGLPGRN